MAPITPVSTHIALPSAAPASVSQGAPGEFQNILDASIKNVEQHRSEARQAVQQYLSGETEDVHKVALVAQRAELTSELFMQVRNKVVSAYQEIMRMQM